MLQDCCHQKWVQDGAFGAPPQPKSILNEIYILAWLKLVMENSYIIHAGIYASTLPVYHSYIHACMVGTREQTYIIYKFTYLLPSCSYNLLQ